MSIQVTTTEEFNAPPTAPTTKEGAGSEEQSASETDESGSESDTDESEAETHDDSDSNEEGEDSGDEGETEKEETEESEEESDDNDSEDEEEEEEEGEEDEDKEKDPPKKRKSGFKKRIDKLITRNHDKDKRIAHLEQRLADQQQGKPAQEQNASEETPNEEQTKQDVSGKPNIDSFEEYEDYIDALTTWKVDKRMEAEAKKTSEAQQKQKINKSVETFQTKAKALATELDDFEDVINDVDDIIASPALQMALLDSENGPRLMYELASDPKEYKRVNELGELGVAKALGRLEAKIELSSDSSEKKTKTVKKRTNAPKPLGKIGTKGKGSKKDLYDPNLTQSEYEAIMRERSKKK